MNQKKSKKKSKKSSKTTSNKKLVKILLLIFLIVFLISLVSYFKLKETNTVKDIPNKTTITSSEIKT
jgi:CHASE3 domain sensor protein